MTRNNKMRSKQRNQLQNRAYGLKLDDIPKSSHTSKQMYQLDEKIRNISNRQNKFQQLLDENELHHNPDDTDKPTSTFGTTDNSNGGTERTLRNELATLAVMIEEVRTEFSLLQQKFSDIELTIDNL